MLIPLGHNFTYNLLGQNILAKTPYNEPWPLLNQVVAHQPTVTAPMPVFQKEWQAAGHVSPPLPNVHFKYECVSLGEHSHQVQRHL